MPDRTPFTKQSITPNPPAIDDLAELPRIQESNKLQALDELKVGQAGMIVSINSKETGNLHELSSFGISAHAFVRMLANHRSHVIFRINMKKFVADKEIAAGILVQPIGYLS